MRLKTFGIIGAGTVGTLLAVSLERSGLYGCGGVQTRSRESYERFCGFMESGRQEPVPLSSVEDLVRRCSLIFITTPDDAIAQVARAVLEKAAMDEGTLEMLIHCSGALSWQAMEVEDIRAKVRYAGVHPYRAFASIADGLDSVRGTHFGVDGCDEEAVAQGLDIVQALGGIFHRIPEGSKTLYHAAAVVASNYLVTLAAMGAELLEGIGLLPEERLELLLPLMEGTLDNLKKGGFDVLTGPIARGDVEVVRRHLAHLPEEMRGMYTSLGMWALKVARRQYAKANRSYPEEAEAELRRLLTER